MDGEQNTRATRIVTSKQQQQVQLVIEQLQNKQHINAFFVLSKYIDCAQVKNEPEFCQILFEDHIQVIVELIEWMLTPKQVIKKKKIKTNVDSYPYQCRQFMKDNWCFYEQMYIAARKNRLDFSIWFNFLRKQYFDKQTIYTALGYFADVMIPFAKYEFSGSFSLTQSVQASQIYKNIQTLSILKILPQSLIDQLITYCYYEPIFQFLKTSILVSIEDPRDFQLAKKAAIKLLKGVKIKQIYSKFPINSLQVNDQVAKIIQYLQNIYICLKQLIQNIEPNNCQFSFRNDALIQSILSADLIKDCVDELIKSRLISSAPGKQRQRLHSSVVGTNQQSDMQSNNISCSMQIVPGVYHNLLPSIGSLPLLTDADQEQLAQVMFKILASVLQIFARVPKVINDNDASINGDCSLNIQISEVKLIQITNSPGHKINKQKPREITFSQYTAMMQKFHEQIQYILTNLETLTKFVYNQNETLGGCASKVIPFSTGQNIKSISTMKHEYFKLLKNCLIVIQCKQAETHNTLEIIQSKQSQLRKTKKTRQVSLQPFEIRIQKLHPLQIIKKYLNENRWNNLAHHTLQNICHLLIMFNYQYIKKNIEKDQIKKFSQSFLSYLIQNFTKRDFIFLNTVKFTTQGNLHSLYNISKDLAYTLNSTNELVVFLNQFEPWKKFIMTDLKNYEQHTYPKAIKPEFSQDAQNEDRSIKVDEVDSIKKLIQNISDKPKKWPTRQKNKQLSKSGVYDSQKNTTQQPVVNRNITQRSTEEKQKNIELKMDDLLKHRIERSKKGKQVQQFNLEGISVRENINRQKLNKSDASIKTAKSTSQLLKDDIKETDFLNAQLIPTKSNP